MTKANAKKTLKMKGKTILRKQHVHFKPESYIGSFNEVHQRVWIIENGKPCLKTISFIPAVFKLCDELIMNAVQHRIRSSTTHILQIVIRENGTISVTNNGTISFGNVIASINDLQAVFGEEQIGSEMYQRGRGAKLVNMFSRSFFVQMGSKERGDAVKVQWRDNMSFAQQPRVLKYDKQDYTKIQAALDLSRFHLAKFSSDFIGLLQRRAFDLAALHQVRIIFNQRDIRFQSLTDYAQLFTKGGAVYIQEGGGWRVAIGPSENGFQQLSFVNDFFWTRNKGIHVASVIAQITSKALHRHNKRLKDFNQILQSPQKFTSDYFLLISVTLENPQFNNVQRDTLINTKLPVPFQISDNAMEFLNSQRALKAYSEMARQRDQSKSRGQNRKQTFRISCLQDADKAGTSSRCTLLIVENQATRHLMSIGLECTCRQYFGIYTLKEKPPNARELKNPLQHSDFSSIAKALGFPTSSQNIQDLRYGSVLIVTDQGSQGISIKGLLLNFFQVCFPWALQTKGFVKLFVPPVVRCVNAIGNIREFLNDRDYRSWSSLNSTNEWTPTYFRNIGSMDPLYMRDLFADRKKYSFSVVYQSHLDEGALSLPYGNDIDIRRKWLDDHRPEAILDYNLNSKTVSTKQFVDKELSHVFYAEATRYLPSSLDGLTPIQRKVLYCLLRVGQGHEIHVQRLAGQILQEFKEENLEAVRKSILTMGRNYVGSNNLPLIEAIGHFGSRIGGGRDHAPARHLRTSLSPYIRLLFPKQDDDLLPYSTDQPQPFFYIPILPIILINGFSQCSMLWRCVVHPHKVNQIIDITKEMLAKKSLKSSLLPGWEGFKGQVQKKNNSFCVNGSYEPKSTRTVTVKEIPPIQSIRDYRSMLQGRDQVQDVKQQQKGDNCLLIIRFKEGRIPRDLHSFLQLSITIHQTPAILMAPASKPKKYISLGNIMEDYLQARLKLYQKRKEAQQGKLIRAIELANEKIRFIRDVLSGQFQLTDSQQAWRNKFIRKGYKRYQDFHRYNSMLQLNEPYRQFQYLQRMQMTEFSERKIIQIRAERVENEEKLAQIKKISERDMWLRQIALFEDRWRKVTRQREQMILESVRQAQNCYKQQPSEPSINNKQNFDFDDLDLDINVEQEHSRTQGVSEDDHYSKQRPVSINGIRKCKPETKPKELTQKEIARAEWKKEKQQFQRQIKLMEFKNAEFQERMRKEAEGAKKEADKARKQEIMDKQRSKQAQKAKKQEQQRQRLKDLREREKEKDKAKILREANNRRQALGRHAMEIGKKVEEHKQREQDEKEKSEKSNRNHLPNSGNSIPKITVPYPCDSSTFMVTHVQRKRFSSRDAKMDQGQINRIHADMRKQNEEDERRASNRNTAFIDLDQDA